MKKTFLNFSMSMLYVIISGIILSLILAILKSNQIIQGNTVNVILTIMSIVLFFLFGLIFSLKQKKRGLLNALLIILCYLFIYFIVETISQETTPIYLTISRIGAVLLGSIFGVNLVSKSDQTN